MWVAGGNVPSAKCSNDQCVTTYSVVWLLFGSFQQLQSRSNNCGSYCVPPLRTGSRKRGLAEGMPFLKIVRSIMIFWLLYAYRGPCSGCPIVYVYRSGGPTMYVYVHKQFERPRGRGCGGRQAPAFLLYKVVTAKIYYSLTYDVLVLSMLQCVRPSLLQVKSAAN